MSRSERVTVGVCLALLLVAGVVGGLTLYGEVADLWGQVELAVGARPAPAAAWGNAALPTPVVARGSAGGVMVVVLGVSHPQTSTTAVSVGIRGSGALDPLLDLPVLTCGGQSFAVTGASLAQARQDLLALITQGEATVSLTFQGVCASGVAGTLVLNPAQPADGLAPRLEVRVP